MAALEKQDEVLIVNRRTGKALQCTGLDNGQVVVQAAPSGMERGEGKRRRKADE